MHFHLGSKSLANLEGVHDDLKKVVIAAIGLSAQDFTVFEGLRSLDKQRENVAKGVSKTMNSRHLTGHAVDLVPWIDGKPKWEWEPIYVIAKAVRQAAIELNVPIRWGGAWDVRLNDLSDDLEAEVKAYTARKKEEQPGHKVFLDGPHMELPVSEYPS